MDKKEIAAQLTAALIAAGHVPPATHQGVDSAAGHAVDLYNAVLKGLSESDRP